MSSPRFALPLVDPPPLGEYNGSCQFPDLGCGCGMSVSNLKFCLQVCRLCRRARLFSQRYSGAVVAPRAGTPHESIAKPKGYSRIRHDMLSARNGGSLARQTERRRGTQLDRRWRYIVSHRRPIRALTLTSLVGSGVSVACSVSVVHRLLGVDGYVVARSARSWRGCCRHGRCVVGHRGLFLLPTLGMRPLPSDCHSLMAASCQGLAG